MTADELEPTEAQVAAFRLGWAAADQAGLRGQRVRSGLRAALNVVELVSGPARPYEPAWDPGGLMVGDVVRVTGNPKGFVTVWPGDVGVIVGSRADLPMAPFEWRVRFRQGFSLHFEPRYLEKKEEG